MLTIDWLFSPDTLAGTRAVSLGLSGRAGLPFVVKSQTAYSNDGTDASTPWTKSIGRPGMTSGFLVVHVVASTPTIAATPADLAISLDGTLMGLDVAYVQTSEVHVLEAVGYLYVGNLADFPDGELSVDFSALGLSGTVNLCVEVIYFDGIDDVAPAIFSVGTVDVFTSPLALDPGPSNDFEVVITFAAIAKLFGPVTITIDTDGYTQETDQITIPSGAGSGAWYHCDVSFNCECETDPDAQTLAELRVETLKLTGYAAQASNPPPGVKDQYNALLRTAQAYLVTKYKALETERFFSWTMKPGIRFYGLRDNRNCCEVKLNKYRITGAWLQDLNNVWWPLIDGIDPTFYTLNVNFGWPAYYEVRSCIEVFPAPQAAYTLWIKGHYELLPFTDDADVTTISAEPVKNWAVYLAKAAKGMADANTWAAMAKDQIGQLTSGAHRSRRYIPGTSEIPVPTPPVMVHFDA